MIVPFKTESSNLGNINNDNWIGQVKKNKLVIAINGHRKQILSCTVCTVHHFCSLI